MCIRDSLKVVYPEEGLGFGIMGMFIPSEAPDKDAAYSFMDYIMQPEDVYKRQVLSCLVSAVIGTLGAVGLSRIHWKSKGALEYISILPLMIPEIILGMVLMAFFYMLNLPFGMLTLLIGHTVFCVPYILMEVKARLAGMDPALEEAARDLGAGPFRAFRDITLPLIMPAVISGSLLAFAMSMDDVVISIFVNGPRLSTLPIKVYTQLKTGVTPEINALCTILLAATLVIFIVYSLITKKKK